MKPGTELKRYAVTVKHTRWVRVGVTAENAERAGQIAVEMQRWATGGDGIIEADNVREVEDV